MPAKSRRSWEQTHLGAASAAPPPGSGGSFAPLPPPPTERPGRRRPGRPGGHLEGALQGPGAGRAPRDGLEPLCEGPVGKGALAP